MKSKWFRWLCYATGVLFLALFLAIYIQMNRYEKTVRADVRYDRLKNELVQIRVR